MVDQASVQVASMKSGLNHFRRAAPWCSTVLYYSASIQRRNGLGIGLKTVLRKQVFSRQTGTSCASIQVADDRIVRIPAATHLTKRESSVVNYDEQTLGIAMACSEYHCQDGPALAAVAPASRRDQKMCGRKF
jgi:hypothetical protein